MMFSMFAMPKAFRGQFRVIQENAIRSWTRLIPRPEIVLLGDDEGTAEFAREVGVRHVQHVERNRHGTPLVSDVFRKGQQSATHDLVCYLNSDIILMSDFAAAAATVVEHFGQEDFLMIGRKRTIELPGAIDFNSPDWEKQLRSRAKESVDYPTWDSDFFVFRKGLYGEMPDFAIGRCFWTQWLIFEARRRRVPVIDATPVVLSVESRHDYSHATSTGGAKRLSGVEFEINRRLFRRCRYFTTLDATHELLPTGLGRVSRKHRLWSPAVRLHYFIYFLMKGTLYPYSLPVIYIGRHVLGALKVMNRAKSWLTRKLGPEARLSRRDAAHRRG